MKSSKPLWAFREEFEDGLNDQVEDIVDKCAMELVDSIIDEIPELNEHFSELFEYTTPKLDSLLHEIIGAFSEIIIVKKVQEKRLNDEYDDEIEELNFEDQ